MLNDLTRFAKLAYNFLRTLSKNPTIRLKGINRISGHIQIYRYLALPRREMVRLLGLFQYLEQTKNIPGDIVECGVGRGKSLAYLAIGIHHLGLKKKVHGFDSFEGFPDPSPDDTSGRKPKAGDWSEASEAMVRERFLLGKMKDILEKYVVLHKGFFKDTLPKKAPKSISFLHIDCDLYGSHLDVLENCYPRLTTGAVIIFDEYGEPKWPGAKRAADEFFSERKENIQYFHNIQRYGVIKIN